MRSFWALILAALAWAPARAEEPPKVEVSPASVRPGDAALIELRGSAPCPVAWLGDRPLLFHAARGRCRSIVGIPVEQRPGPMPIRLGAPDASVKAVGTLEVVAPAFNERELNVAQEFVEPSPAIQKRLDDDREAFTRAFDQPLTPPRFASSFGWPRKAKITAPFGDRRTFNGVQQSQHYGTDLDGKVGAPVRAANDGVVVMVRDNYAAGRTVVIHHGLDVFTTYFHLSKIEVRHGARVKKGQLIGRVGKTGRVTGPHLHWGVRVSGLYVDPESMLRLDLKP